MSTCTPSVVDQRFNRRGDSSLTRLWRLKDGEDLMSRENLFKVPKGECSRFDSLRLPSTFFSSSSVDAKLARLPL